MRKISVVLSLLMNATSLKFPQRFATQKFVSKDFVPDMERRNIMNLILLVGGIIPSVGGLAIPYILFFIPKTNDSTAGGLPALSKAGDKITFEGWLDSHVVGDRQLVQGLKGDATYLIVDEDDGDNGKQIRNYGINAVCTHLGLSLIHI